MAPPNPPSTSYSYEPQVSHGAVPASLLSVHTQGSGMGGMGVGLGLRMGRCGDVKP
jgi:hypothetical protein